VDLICTSVSSDFTVSDYTTQEWLIDNGEDTNAYYFEAVKKGENWSGVEYDEYLDNYSVTYSRGCWDKNWQLIGVMGSDIFINNIFNTVKNIQLEEGGYAFLIDSRYEYLAGSKTEKIYNEMKRADYAMTSNGWTLAAI